MKERNSTPEPLTIETVAQIAQEAVLRDGHHAPTLLVEGSQRTAGVIVEMLETHEQRARQMFVAGATLGQSGELGKLQQVFMITEAWMSQVEGDKPPHYPPSQDPKRVEVLLISQLTRTGQTGLLMFEMIRDASGTLTDLLQLHDTQQPGAAADSPLLAAFAAGYELGLRGRQTRRN